MKYPATGLGLAAAIGIAGSAAAQGFEHKRSEIELSYDHMEIEDSFGPDGLTVKGWEVNGRSDFGISGAFGTQINLTYRDGELSSGGDTASINTSKVALHPYYAFGPTARVGAFFQYGSTEGEETFDVDSTYYGLEAILTPTSNVNIELFVGFGDHDGDGGSLNTKIYGTEVSYGFTPNFGGRLAYQAEEIEIPGTSASISFSEFTVGADYYSDGFGSDFPFVVSAEYARVDLFELTEDRFGVGVTFAFGGGSDSSSRKLYSERGIFDMLPIFGS